MARLNDHDVRDAEHALRMEISLVLARYARRMLERGKAYITEEAAQLIKEGKDVDGITLGRTAAERVKFEYFSTGAKAEAAIEASSTRQLTEGWNSAPTGANTRQSGSHKKRKGDKNS